MSIAASLAAAELSGSIEYCVCVHPTVILSAGIVRLVVDGVDGPAPDPAAEAGTVEDDDRVTSGPEIGPDSGSPEEQPAATTTTTRTRANRRQRALIHTPRQNT